MTYIELKEVSLDYIIKSGSNSIKKTIISLINNNLKKTAGQRNTDFNSTFRALNNINLQIKEGDKVGLLGRNGAGKSTLLRVFANIYKPTHGIINIHGTISTLFDINAGMNIDSSGYENINNIAILRRIPKKVALSLRKDIEDFTDLGSFLNKPVRNYSSGMQLKLAFGVSTAIPSEILLIDEIIGVGDSQFLKKATNRLGNMINSSKILVLTSHSIDIVRRFCNKVIILDKGSIKFFGDMEEAIKLYESIL